jgi:hypothetical protein
VDEQLAHVLLSDAGEVEGRVLAQSDQSENRVKGVLVGGEGIDTNGKWQDELCLSQQDCH